MKASLAALVLLAAAVQNSAAGCELTDQQFSDQVDALTDWRAFHAFQVKHFPPCMDDGMYGQAHTEWVSRSLASRWVQLPELISITLKHPDFKSFVFRHVNSRAPKSDLQLILGYTTFRCPSGQAAFCSELRARAGAALEQLK